MLFNPKKDTAAKVGIDNKKDILAASYLLNLKILAPVMVIPDLLTPGIKDNIWRKPMNIADLKVKFDSNSFSMENLSLIKRSRPNIKVVQPIVLIFLNWSIKLSFTKIYPTIIIGIDPIMILKNKSQLSYKC